MKTPSQTRCHRWILTVAAVWILSSVTAFGQTETSESGLSAQDILQRALDYHDPLNKWSEYQGTIRLITTFGGGDQGDEIIEIRNEDFYYKSTRRRPSEIVVMGVNAGACFRSINGDPFPSDEDIISKSLSDEQIYRTYQHHLSHIGLIMTISKAGIPLEPEVVEMDFNGHPVYALHFAGDQESAIHSHWAADWIIFIDRETFSVRGYHAKWSDWPELISETIGEIVVEGIRIPSTKVYYYGSDGSHAYTDIITRP